MDHGAADERLGRLADRNEGQAGLGRIRPSTLSAYLAPLTPGSAKIAACNGVRRSWILSA